MSLLTQEQAQELVEAALPEIKESFIASVKEQATRELRHLFAAAVRQEVEKFMAEKVVPEVARALIENEAGILASAAEAAGGIAHELTTCMVGEVAERLKGHGRRAILKSLFGSAF